MIKIIWLVLSSYCICFCVVICFISDCADCWVLVAMWASSRYGGQGCSPAAICGPLTMVGPPVAEHVLRACRLQQLQPMGSAVAAPGLWSTALQMWYTGWVALQYVGLSRQGIEPMSPALGDRFFTKWQILYHWVTREALIASVLLVAVLVAYFS